MRSFFLGFPTFWSFYCLLPLLPSVCFPFVFHDCFLLTYDDLWCPFRLHPWRLFLILASLFRTWNLLCFFIGFGNDFGSIVDVCESHFPFKHATRKPFQNHCFDNIFACFYTLEKHNVRYFRWFVSLPVVALVYRCIWASLWRTFQGTKSMFWGNRF